MTVCNSEYKMGELIQVIEILGEYNRERLFIKDGHSGGVVCVAVGGNENFKNGESFNTTHWDFHRKIPKKTWRPFTMEEFKEHRDKWFKPKNDLSNYTMRVDSYDNIGVYLSGNYNKRSWQDLMEKYAFEDGSVCGVEE